MADGISDLAAQEFLQARVLTLTTRIVVAYVTHNHVAPPELPRLIHKVYASLAQVGTGAASSGARGLTPAVPINRSVFPDYIICLEDGRRLRTLRRHLMAAFGLTPEAYRRRWGLPHNYPMTAPSYTKARSGLAKATGLGHASRTSSGAAHSR